MKQKNHLAGKQLRPENRATSYLGLRFRGSGGAPFQPDAHVVEMQGELEKLGYRIAEEIRGSSESRQFERKEDAEEYLRSTGTAIDGMTLQEQKAMQYAAIYPVNAAEDFKNFEDAKTLVIQSTPFLAASDTKAVEEMARLRQASVGSPALSFLTLQDLRLEPGSTVKRTGDRRWLINRPARYTARALTRIATVMKIPKNTVGFEMVRAQGTNGLNYSISNEMVVDKLKYWDEKYGVTVLEASGDTMKIRFKNLPDDLSELCSEIFLFCPEIELSADENANAAIMRVLARSIRATNETSFWWD